MADFPMAEHSNDLDHHILLNKSIILANKSRRRGQIMEESDKDQAPSQQYQWGRQNLPEQTMEIPYDHTLKEREIVSKSKPVTSS
jgi:hypothetical protein